MTPKERALKALEYMEEMLLRKCEETNTPQELGPGAVRIFVMIIREALED